MRSLSRVPGAVWSALLTALPFANEVLGRAVWHYDDAGRFSAPLGALAGEAMCSGHLPLWDPYTLLGTPLLSNPTAVPAHPGWMLACALGADHAYALLAVGHLALLAAGLTLLLGELGIRRILAIAGGAALALSGPAVSMLTLFPHLVTLSLLPFSLRQALRAGRGVPGAAAGLGLALGLGGTGGDVIGALVAAATCTALVVLGAHARGHARSAWRPLATAAGLSAAIAAIVWLPLMWFAPLSQRGLGLDVGEAGRWSMHPAELVSWWWPDPLGLPLPEYSLWPRAWIGDRLLIHSQYFGAGLATLALAGVVVFRREWSVRALGAGALLGLVIALGTYTPLWPLLRPLFTFMRYPSKALPPALLLLGVLGVYTLDRLLEGSRLAKIALAATAGWAALGALLGPWLQARVAAMGQPDAFLLDRAAHLLRSNCLATAAITAGLALAIHLLARDRARAPLYVGLVAVLLVGDGWRHGTLLDWSQPAVQNPPLGWLPAKPPWGARVLRFGQLAAMDLGLDELTHAAEDQRQRAVLQPSTNIERHVGVLDAYGLYLHGTAAAMAALVARDPIDLAEVAACDHVLGPDLPIKQIRLASEQGRLALLGKLRAGAFAYQAKTALPRAYLATSARVVTPDEAVSAIVRGQHHETALVTRDTLVSGGHLAHGDVAGLLAPLVATSPAPFVPVTPASWRPAAMSFEVVASAPSLLVVMDAFTAGWQAEVDGADAPILEVNRLGRGVVLPQGAHRVTMSFAPRAFALAPFLSGAGLAAALALGALARRRARLGA